MRNLYLHVQIVRFGIKLFSSSSVLIRITSKKQSCSKKIPVSPLTCYFYMPSFRWLAMKGYDPDEKRVAVKEQIFEHLDSQDKETFLTTIHAYCEKDKSRRSHLEFIYAAMKYMEKYGVEDDLETYKRLFDIFPKGRFIAQNIFQREFMHFPKHQQCAIELLEQMEYHGVIPDKEVQDMIYNIFGKYSYVHRKFARMAYWMPKFKNLSPFPLPRPLPNEVLELAKLAIQRMSVDLRNAITVYDAKEIKESLDKTWIVSGQSLEQQELLENHPLNKTVYVEGPFIIWLRKIPISYFILRADPKPLPEDNTDCDDVSKIPVQIFKAVPPEASENQSLHEQEDSVIFASCATGTSSRDSLLSWIRFLQESNPRLKDLPVLFTLRAPSKDLVTLNEIRDMASTLPESAS